MKDCEKLENFELSIEDFLKEGEKQVSSTKLDFKFQFQTEVLLLIRLISEKLQHQK